MMALLDIRRIIAGLLGVYGVILLVAGIVGSSADKNKAAGVNINLWAGIVLLVMEAEAEGSATEGADRTTGAERPRPGEAERPGPDEPEERF
jgi:hypothetical protein